MWFFGLTIALQNEQYKDFIGSPRKQEGYIFYTNLRTHQFPVVLPKELVDVGDEVEADQTVLFVGDPNRFLHADLLRDMLTDDGIVGAGWAVAQAFDDGIELFFTQLDSDRIADIIPLLVGFRQSSGNSTCGGRTCVQNCHGWR